MREKQVELPVTSVSELQRGERLSIPAVGALRYSITFRNLREG